MNKIDIKNFTLWELKREMRKLSVPSYRAEQVFYWIYKKGVSSFFEMNNIPKGLMDKLNALCYIGDIKLEHHLKSCDGTEKFLFELSDGNFIESVLISTAGRKTICLSTQVGCKYRCIFCASGLRGFVRDLTTSEILNQILSLRHGFNHRITNFVFMGMGEPLDNYGSVSKAIMLMNSKEALGIAARRITVSTCGIIPGIDRFKDMGIQANLSLSLHAVNDRLRASLMPVNKRYPLRELIRACKDFVDKTGRRITLEYILIKDKNDSLKEAVALSRIAKRLNAKINLIPYSLVPNMKFTPPSKERLDAFKDTLVRDKVNVTLRDSKGRDIQAACGQLAIIQK